MADYSGGATPPRQARAERGAAEAPTDTAAADPLLEVLDALRTHTDYDFSLHKRGTLKRRIQRRMSLARADTLDRYADLLRADAVEASALFGDIMIGVTRFFRDAEVWEVLRRQAAAMVRRKAAAAEEVVRVWVPGCATGEEAYSVAMVFLDQFARQQCAMSLQVFGTDINPAAVATARAGAYPARISEHVDNTYLRQFFVRQTAGYKVTESLRASLVFAHQNLAADPPFSRLDLICCRNVLIYLEPEAQQRVLETFHFGLRPDGLLFLGTAESPGRGSGLFEPVAPPQHIYRRRNRLRDLTLPPRRISIAGGGTREAIRVIDDRTEAGLVQRILLEQFTPAAVLINDRAEVLYQHGVLRKYLDFPSGEPTTDLFKMVIAELRPQVRSLVAQAVEGSSGRADGMALGGKAGGVRIQVQPARSSALRGVGERLLLVSFTPVDRQRGDGAAGELPAESLLLHETVERLERELQSTRDELQGSVDAQAASNEELMSTNEELQSANEELEAAKEELQSLNEEITTVNRQLEEKLTELERAHDDLSNLLTSTQIATLFLDNDLRVRQMTPACGDLLHLTDEQLGAPIAGLPLAVVDDHLQADARRVLRRLDSIEREVASSDGRVFIRRVLPYRTVDDRIEGVVLTFTDITALQRAMERVTRRERQQALVAELGARALGGMDLQDLFERTVTRAAAALDVDYVKLLELLPDRTGLRMRAGFGWAPGSEQELVPTGYNSQAGYTLECSAPVIVQNLLQDVRFNGPDLLRRHGVTSGISVILGRVEQPWGTLGFHTREERAFSFDDINFVQALAHVLTDAIERVAVVDLLTQVARRAGLLYQSAISEAVDLPAALRACIEGVCRVEKWAVGHAYLVPADSTGLEVRDIWHGDDQDLLERTRRLHTGRSFAPGEGAAGRALVSAAADVEELDGGDGLPGALHGLGFVARVAIPIIVQQRVVAVLEFFSLRPCLPETLPPEYVRTLGEQVGRVYERNRAEADLKASAERLEVALEAGKLVAWDWNIPANELVWSDQFEKVIGYEPKDGGRVLPGWQQRLHPDDRKRVLADIEHARRSRNPYVSQFRILPDDGSVRWMEARGRYLYGPDGKAVRMFGVMIDFTERRAMEDRLMESDRRKDMFLATLGHELRNPLAALANGVELLGRAIAGGEPVSPDALAMMRRQTSQMTSLLNELLDSSRISRGDIRIDRKRVPLQGLFERLEQSFSADTLRAGLTLALSVEPPELEAFADPVRLEQIVGNLLANALRYTPAPGRVSMLAELSGPHLRISVADTGVGMSSEQISQVFEPFYQANKGSGGLGLGLSIVKQLAELQEGWVEASSPGLGQGSTFTLVLPADRREPARVADVPAQSDAIPVQHSFDGLRILLVDDHRDSVQALAELLGATGCDVRSCFDGASALAGALDHEPHLLILDIGLPDMSGTELAMRLRQQPSLQDSVFIALTGFGDSETGERIREAGFDDHLLKPITLDRLEAIVAKCFRMLGATPHQR